MSDDRTGHPVGERDYVAIQRFLYREAAFLDRREYDKWLGLLTDDIVYRVTARVARDAETGNLDYAIMDEDAAGLRARVEQIGNPRLTRAENPLSFTRRFVANLEASHGTLPDAFTVESNLLVYRNRMSVPEGGLYVGERHDVLRRTGGELRLARRLVHLDHSVLSDGVVSTLF